MSFFFCLIQIKRKERSSCYEETVVDGLLPESARQSRRTRCNWIENYSRTWLHFFSELKLTYFFFRGFSSIDGFVFSSIPRLCDSGTLIENRTSALVSCESSYAILTLPHSRIACGTEDTRMRSWTSNSMLTVTQKMEHLQAHIQYM